MSNEFDPYYNWLGISPEEQPADHYRLLAIRRFEANPEVISNASDQRMGHIRTFQTGKRAAESQRILNELSSATRCLLDAELKKKYDLQLKAQLDAKKAAAAPKATAVAARPVAAKAAAPRPTAPPPVAPQPIPVVAEEQPQPAFSSETPTERLEKKRKKTQSTMPVLLIGAAVFVGMAVVAVGGIAMMMRPSAPVIAEKPKPQPDPSPKPDPIPAPVEKVDKEKVAAKTDNEQANPSSQEKTSSTQAISTPAKDARKLWKASKATNESTGIVREVSPGQWEEKWQDGRTMRFEERERNENEVMLFDKSRNMWVRLSNTALHFRREGNLTWMLSHSGTWVNESALASNPSSNGNVTSQPISEVPPSEIPARKITVIFNGNSKVTLETKDAPLLDLEKPFTLEFWYCHRGAPNDAPGLLRCGDLQLFLTPGSVDPDRGRCYALGVGSSYITSSEMNLDHKWHHIALVRSGGMLSLFVDGRSQIRAVFEKLNITAITPIVFGEAVNGEAVTRKFTGELRSVCVTNSARYPGQSTFTPPESKGFQIPGNVNLQLANGASLVQGHFDNALVQTTPSTGSIPSTDNNPPPSTVSNSVGKVDPESMKPKQDLILVLDGTQKISLESPNPYFDLGKQCTIEYWFRKTDTQQYTPLLKFADITLMLNKESNTRTNFDVFRRNSGGGGPTVALNDNPWQHVVIQLDNDSVHTWINGQRIQLVVSLRSAAEGVPLSPVDIGKGNRYSQGVGLVGEIRSLKMVPVRLYDSNGPGIMQYESYEHGIYVPKNLSLNMTGVKTLAADGGITSRNTLASLVSSAPTEKLPTPDKEKLEAAKATVASVFGAKIKAAIKPEQKLELGQEMLKAARSETDVPLSYAVLGEARTQAMSSLSVQLLMDIVDEVDRRFAVDRLTVLSKLLPEINNSKLPVDQRELLVSMALQASVKALSDEKMTIADDLSDLASNAVKVSKSADLKKGVKATRDHIVAVKLAYEEAQKALATLAQNADDPSANLVVGKYYALGMENFEKGLPYLAKAANSPLAEAAQKELKAKTKEERCAVAEAWYEAASSVKGSDKLTLQRHVADQYEAVVEQISGILQAKAKERLAELKPILDEAAKARQVVTKNTASKKPIPGLIYRLIAGYGTRAIPTPYLGIAQSKQDLERMSYYEYVQKYPSSSSSYSFQLVGLVVVEKDMEVLVSLADCTCLIDGKEIAARYEGVSQRVPMKKGTYPIIINSTYSRAGFQFNRSDNGESLLFHTEEILEAQLNLPAALPNGLPSKGSRIDK